MKQERLYNEMAKYYDFIYSYKDYKIESKKIMDLILKYKKSKGKELLDVGCGTGRHLEYFKKKFKCVGVDLSDDMLRIARKNVKGVQFKKENMINMKLNKKFDIITSLFSGIAHVKTYSNVRRTINTFSSHLKTGGVLIIEPFITKEKFRKDCIGMKTYETDNFKIVRVDTSKKKGNLMQLDSHFLVAMKGKPIEHYSDREQIGLFDNKKILDFMEESGLKSKFLKGGLIGRGLLVGVKT